MNNTKHRSPFAIAARLIVLVRPMLPIMLAAIVMGVIGHFCATFITVFGGFALITAACPARWQAWARPLFASLSLPCCAACCATQSRPPTTISPSSCWPSSGIRCSVHSAA